MRNLLVFAAVVAVAGYFGAKLYIQHKVARDLDFVLTQARPLLVDARMDYVDRSLNGRILAHCAEQQVSADEVIAAQILEVETLARTGGMELDVMLIGPYVEFLRGKQRLTVTSRPNKPVDLTQIGLYKPSDVPNLLNLTAEAI